MGWRVLISFCKAFFKYCRATFGRKILQDIITLKYNLLFIVAAQIVHSERVQFADDLFLRLLLAGFSDLLSRFQGLKRLFEVALAQELHAFLVQVHQGFLGRLFGLCRVIHLLRRRPGWDLFNVDFLA